MEVKNRDIDEGLTFVWQRCSMAPVKFVNVLNLIKNNPEVWAVKEIADNAVAKSFFKF
jgi:hypothetical protein